MLYDFRLFVQKLNEDICSLSTLCSTNSNESEAISKDGLLDAIEKIQCENGRITAAEITSLIRSMQNEVKIQIIVPRTTFSSVLNNCVICISRCQKSQNAQMPC